MDELTGIRIHITGIVQGVGFRPFVHSLASRLGLKGWVRNTSAGVDIQVEGIYPTLQEFSQRLRSEAPVLSVIDSLEQENCQTEGFQQFEILYSHSASGDFQPVSPDVCTCPDCLQEMHSPADRRYRYPFINCTNCGPRFTIITDIPYDRPNTTMTGFPLCEACKNEYMDPLNRRFHAQPVACPVCGPTLWFEPINLEEITQNTNTENPLGRVIQSLTEGKIIAIKGLGGFHLACDATNQVAVELLRKRKLRAEKPFAVMMPDLQTVSMHCYLNQAEKDLLSSRQRPIVILERKPNSNVALQVAPGQATLGVMLPYTPLHSLLFERIPENPSLTPPKVLVMTSGNLSEEPIVFDNDQARQSLSSLADAFLMHNRPIRMRCDDSVVRVISLGGNNQSNIHVHKKEIESNHRAIVAQLRRSRGYAPTPIKLAWEAPPILATGAELKNTFCFTRQKYAFLSHHIGDLQNFEALEAFNDALQHYERLFRLQPVAVAYDLHPDYLATRYAWQSAQSRGVPAFGIQHHHAHIAACMADNQLDLDQVVIGVSFDGSGYGEDGAIWGGEFLLAGYQENSQYGIGDAGYKRIAHLSYMPLPGGDAAIRRPSRIALAYLWRAGIEWEDDLPCVAACQEIEKETIQHQLESGLNVAATSSMGRLFDAVASLVGVRHTVNYEAQAAIELEALADLHEHGKYPFIISQSEKEMDCYQIDVNPILKSILIDFRNGVHTSKISARFHNSCAHLTLEMCRTLRSHSGLQAVALSGGVWQNSFLLKKTIALLEQDRFTVYLPQQTPVNDGGLSLGQAIIAGRRWINQENKNVSRDSR